MSVRNNILKAADATVGALMCHILRLSPRAVNHAEKYPDIEPGKVSSILLIRPGGMGDMVLLWPVIQFIKAVCPAAEIDIVCEQRNTDVLKIAGFDGVSMSYDSNPFPFLRRLLGRKYDVVIDTEQFHHFSAVFAFLSGAPVRIGFKINPRRNALYTHLVNYSLEGYEGEQFMGLISSFLKDGAKYELKNSIDRLMPGLVSSVGDKLAKLGAYAVVQSGASTRYKLWSSDKYIEMLSGLIDRHELGAVLVGDGNDVSRCSEIRSGLDEARQKRCLSLAGEMDLAATAVVMKGADIFIGSDSGLAHLAVAMGVSTVILFGPSDHRKWGVIDGRHAVVRRNLPCSPCFIFGYNKPCESIACMRQIEPSDVLAAVVRIKSADK